MKLTDDETVGGKKRLDDSLKGCQAFDVQFDFTELRYGVILVLFGFFISVKCFQEELSRFHLYTFSFACKLFSNTFCTGGRSCGKGTRSVGLCIELFAKLIDLNFGAEVVDIGSGLV